MHLVHIQYDIVLATVTSHVHGLVRSHQCPIEPTLHLPVQQWFGFPTLVPVGKVRVRIMYPLCPMFSEQVRIAITLQRSPKVIDAMIYRRGIISMKIRLLEFECAFV